MAVCYLEVDDEITSAIGRIRGIRDGEVVIVVPPGSRIATSRINFKLLAREASERRLNAVAVSDEPAVRALAISAGLPAYDSLAGAEQALANFREQDRRLAERIGRPAGAPAPTAVMGIPDTPAQAAAARTGSTGRVADPPAADDRARRALDTKFLTAPSVAESAGGALHVPGDTGVLPRDSTPASDAERRTARPRGRRRRIGVAPLLVLALLALLVGSIAFAGYLFLPTATITLRPAATLVRLPETTVAADPNAAVIDVDANVIPAQRVDVPLTLSDSFRATGSQARETRASGRVRFRSENTLNEIAIPSDTRVSTADGIDFVTQESVTVPRASFASGPTTVDVAVRAVRAGPRGNVAADTITELPQSLAAQLVTVRNPEPTSGGRRVEEAVVTQGDYDAAVQALTEQLDAALAATLADPASVPRGLTMFPSTATVGTVRPDPPAAAVVGQVTDSFELSLEASGEVIAVNESLLGELAATRLRASLADGQQLVTDGIEAEHSAGVVDGETITYTVSASAEAYTEPNRLALVEMIRGRTVGEARQILAEYGMVEIDVWPDFIDRLPEQDARINLNIVQPTSGS